MLAQIILACAPGLDERLMASLIKRESSFNQFAIGMDSKHKVQLQRQPRSIEEAIVTAKDLVAKGYSFSVGLTQIHISNLKKYGLEWEHAFDPCTSLKISHSVFMGFYQQALTAGYRNQNAVYAALRGYNSGSVNYEGSNGYATAILTDALKMKTNQLEKLTISYSLEGANKTVAISTNSLDRFTPFVDETQSKMQEIATGNNQERDEIQEKL